MLSQPSHHPAPYSDVKAFCAEAVPRVVRQFSRRQFDAEDLVQNAVAAVLRGRAPGSGGPDPRHTDAYLRRIVSNGLAKDAEREYLREIDRRLGRCPRIVEADDQPMPAPAEAVGYLADVKDMAQRTLALMADMEHDPVNIYILVQTEMHGRSGQDLADELGISRTAVEGRKSRLTERVRRAAPDMEQRFAEMQAEPCYAAGFRSVLVAPDDREEECRAVPSRLIVGDDGVLRTNVRVYVDPSRVRFGCMHALGTERFPSLPFPVRWCEPQVLAVPAYFGSLLPAGEWPAERAALYLFTD